MRLNIFNDDIITDGVRIDDNGRYIFDKFNDFPTDIMDLNNDVSGVYESDDITYVYAYSFKEGVSKEIQKGFRDALKHNFKSTDLFYTDSVFDFVEDGVFRLDAIKRIDTFDVLVVVRPTGNDESLLDLVVTLVEEYAKTCFVTIGLIKKMLSEVTFDEEKAFIALKNTEKYGDKTDAQIRREIAGIVRNIQKRIKNNPLELFQMKRFLPSAARKGFSDFLKFKTEQDERLFRRLEKGTEVLICDDFVTSGSTLKEMKSFLESINPNVNITAFALINQNRQY